MCLAVPGKIVSIYHESNPKMAKVNFGGVIKEVCLEFVPEAKVNNYAVVHVGFAISIVDEREAEETLKMFEEMERLADEEDKELGS
ncbi:MAG: HypC/HybG/HupF family hydrogenase formation chaperone [Bacteroidota bacterium]|nr:HypC/HybG/HupF family hydrogenase formation chaperone [Bacteroidota bacterium]